MVISQLYKITICCLVLLGAVRRAHASSIHLMKVSFIAPYAKGSLDTSQQSRGVDNVRLRARISYDGTNYSGWQFQVKTPTIQAELEKAISRRIGVHARVVGASRTDSGVHARGQGVHFDVPRSCIERCCDLSQLQFVVNQMLPRDIRMIRLDEAPLVEYLEQEGENKVSSSSKISELETSTRPWHAIYCSTGKLYTYRFSTNDVLDPLQRLYRHHEWRAAKFDFYEDRLHEAAARFVGRHDFSAFTNTTQPPPGVTPPVVVNPFRVIRSVDVIREGNESYRVEFRIDGALYRMIRNIMGTLLEVACGKLDLSMIEYMFESKDRRLVPKSAPARGLCLEEVFYDNWEL